MRKGEVSTRHPHMGVRVLSLGPHSPVPGERLQIVIYNAQDEIVRRLEQIQAECMDPGYVDFFLGPNCRPVRYRRPIVDIAPDGTVTEIFGNFAQNMGPDLWYSILADWVSEHGIPQEQE